MDILNLAEKPDLDDIEHYGVKGMKWGVRKKRDASSPADKKKVAAKVLLGAAGLAALILLGSSTTNRVVTESNGPAARRPSAGDIERGRRIAESLTQEPVGIVHSSRAYRKGFTFPQRGGLSDPQVEYTRAGFAQREGEFVKRYGDRGEKVAARFNDPEGRTDFTGRGIEHEVMLPESLARGVYTLDQARNVSWPLIEDTYAAFYDSSLDNSWER